MRIFIVSIVLSIVLSTSAFGQIVINEISYNPCAAQGSDADCEFIEIYNESMMTIDLSGFSVDDPTYSFLPGTSIGPNEYILIVDNAATIGSCYMIPPSTQIFEWSAGNLGNSGEMIQLFDGSSNLVDNFIYYDNPCGADGDCNSLQYTGTGNNSDCAMGNWVAATPSPGDLNNVSTVCTISNITIENSNCTGTNFSFQVNFDAINASGIYNVIDANTMNVLATGSSGMSVILLSNTSTTPFDIFVQDSVDPTCISPTITVQPGDCSYIPTCANPGDLIFTEILADEVPGGNEWVEIYNNTANDINLEGFEFKDLSNSHIVFNGGTLIAPANDYVLISFNNMIGCGAAQASYNVYNFGLNNSGDIIQILCDGQLIDEVAFGFSLEGVSLEFNHALLDGINDDIENDDVALNWCYSETACDMNEFGSPLQDNMSCPLVVCPNPGDIIVSEIMKNPSVVADINGEWFEIYNTSNLSIDLYGSSFSDLDGDQFLILNTVIIGPGQYLVLGPNADVMTNGGVNVDVEINNFNLGNADDEIIISCGGSIIDEVYYDAGPNFPDPTSISFQLSSSKLDALLNDNGNNWCISTSPYGDGELGTPGAANFACGSVCPSDYAGANALGGTDSGPTDYETDGAIESSQILTITDMTPIDYDSAVSIELGIGFEISLGVMPGTGAVFCAFIDGCNGAGGIISPINKTDQEAK